MKGKNEHEFNKVIKACELFGLTDIMSLKYNWNEEVLAQFNAPSSMIFTLMRYTG